MPNLVRTHCKVVVKFNGNKPGDAPNQWVPPHKYTPGETAGFKPKVGFDLVANGRATFLYGTIVKDEKLASSDANKKDDVIRITNLAICERTFALMAQNKTDDKGNIVTNDDKEPVKWSGEEALAKATAEAEPKKKTARA